MAVPSMKKSKEQEQLYELSEQIVEMIDRQVHCLLPNIFHYRQ